MFVRKYQRLKLVDTYMYKSPKTSKTVLSADIAGFLMADIFRQRSTVNSNAAGKTFGGATFA